MEDESPAELIAKFVEGVKECEVSSRFGRPASSAAITSWQAKHPRWPLPQSLRDIYAVFNGVEICNFFDLFRVDKIQDAKKQDTYLDIFFDNQIPEEEVLVVGQQLDAEEFLLYYPIGERFRLITQMEKMDVRADLSSLLDFLKKRYAPLTFKWEAWSTAGTAATTKVDTQSGNCLYVPQIQAVFKEWHVFASQIGGYAVLDGWKPHDTLANVRSQFKICDLSLLPHSKVTQMAAIGEHLVFAVEDGQRLRLMVSHAVWHASGGAYGGGDAGLIREFEERSLPAPKRFLSVCGAYGYFNVYASDGMDELWRTDGTADGTIMLQRFEKLGDMGAVEMHGAVWFFAGRVARRKVRKK